MLDRETLSHWALALGLVGVALLLSELWLTHGGRAQRLRRTRDVLLALTGLAAALSWWDVLLLPREQNPPELRWVSLTDSFHYYMGPKYFRELGYTQLYACSAVAEFELGSGAEVAQRVYRDLESNGAVSGRRLIAGARDCRRRFSPERWRVFVHDVDWFRRRVPYWSATMQDWGYNATPVWNALGSLLAGSGPVSERQLAWLTLLDVPILWACFGLVAWAFGWRTACVASIFWGTNLANGYGWTGGSILRDAWLLASVAGVCLLRKEKPLTAGAAITTAALLTIFPGFLAVGVGARAIRGWIAERRVTLTAAQRRLLAGAVLTLAIALPAAVPSGGTAAAWEAFVANSRSDSAPSPNNMGLPALLSYEPTTRLRILQLGPSGTEQWVEARERTLAARRPLQAVLVAAFLGLAIGALRRQPDWVAALLGLGLVVFVFELSCYYYAFMLLFGTLWPRHRSIGIALCGIAAVSVLVGERFGGDDEDIFAALSLLAVAFVGYATVVLRFARTENSARV